MPLPAELSEAIERETRSFEGRALIRAAAALSDRYRAQSGAGGILTLAERAAYLAVRLPATWAAVHAVLSELRGRIPGAAPQSLLDLGAGPGTTAWAAADVFADLETITCVEHDREFAAIGRRLASSSRAPAVRNAHWTECDLRVPDELPGADVVVLSYAAGELEDAAPLIERAWIAAAQALVVIEPGTPGGFARIRTIRDQLIRAGAAIAAPCPHSAECPVRAPDWCHFAVRLDRSSLHRRLKGGNLGYEDEKFSYVIASRRAVAPVESRIVRHPWTEPGLVRLELCAPEGLKTRDVRKHDKVRFRRARKAGWGGEWTE